ncbi:phosphate ABC transporter substrate-binding protein [Amycolatopsis acidicola]|uniref:Phosphate ABC transporter substrate-binding protein n=1 Tax=Amycolatopsis acidicola TaxID=2596893 RepID=A0A5N0UUF2_9PSEU|nr:substrate-binding domain-containing protein [Amycolatopsis acidicola]KAA9156224.1 phosphate ABC transporter substrate-binding protein [Amycolatopsis acidicola]
MPSDDEKTQLTRALYRAAYPEEDGAGIDEKVTVAARRISLAKEADPSTAAGARRVPDTVVHRAAPVRRRRRHRRLLVAGLAVLAIVVVVLGITQRQWVAEAAISPVGTTGTSIVTALAAVATVASNVRSRRRRILSCRVRIDTPFDVDKGEALRLEGEHAAVADPGFVVVRIKNAGGVEIEPDDYVSPLALHFPGRTVVSVDATESEPVELQRVVTKMPDFTIEPERVKLPMLRLGEEDSYKLVVVLSGTRPGEQHEVTVEGALREGAITTTEGREKIRPATLLWGGLTAVCAGVLAVVLLLNNVTPFTKLPEGVVCVPGEIAVEGSSAFGRAATELAGSYHAYCPQASVKVRTPGSLEGLRRLADNDNRGGQLALSDGRFDDPQFAQLVPQPLAIVPFTFVASANVPVNDLSLEDARRIFTGTARTWSDITGNPRDAGEIRVVGRTTSSGTRQALEQYVLSAPGVPRKQAQSTSDSCRERNAGVAPNLPIVCEQGSTANLTDQIASQDDAIGYADVSDVEQAANVKQISLDGRAATLDDIRAGYPFWTVEYLYSRGWPEPESLPAAFKDYLFTREGRATMAGFQYYACAEDLEVLCGRR